jgi:exosortase A
MTAIADANPGCAKPWRDHGLALGAVILLIVLEFHSALYAALQVWLVSPTYSHCFLIIPISAWLVWEKRDALKTIKPSVAPHFLWFVPVLLVLWWLGELSAINEVRQYAVVALIQVMIVTILGIEVLRVIWFPILFLFFLVPTGEYLIFPMEQFATRFVDVCLNLLNIPHFTEGTTFELTNGRFEIAEACAGLRFLVATVTLGVLFSYLVYRKIYKVVLFLIASVVVPLIGNGLRCVGIILLAHFTSNKYGAGADHIVYGWGFNVAILLILILLGSLFRDDAQEAAFVPTPNGKQDTFQHLAIVMAIAAILVSAGPAFAWWRDARPALPNASVIIDYLQAGGWQEKDKSDNWLPHFPGADAQVLMSLGSPLGAPPIDLFVGYYARPRAGHTVTAHLNLAWDESAWNGAASGVASASTGRNEIRLQETVINSGPQKRLIWSAYWVDGHFTLSPLTVKLLQAKAAFEGQEGQAFVALSTPVDGPVEDARARLARGLSGLGQLSQVLDRANKLAMPPHEGAR